MRANTFLFTLVLATLFFTTCKKTDDNPSDKLDPEGECFTALVDGQAFNSDNVVGTDFGTLLNIRADFGVANFQSFGFNLVNRDIGTYDIPSEVVAEYSEGPLTDQVLYTGESGSLTIQEHDLSAKNIKGIFNFEASDTTGLSVTITEGYFDVKYQ